jgi:putative copper resistance protein D
MDFFWPLIVVRWMHLGSLLILFGASLFALYNGRQADDSKTFPWLASLALLTACGWIIVSLVDMLDGVAGLASAATWHVFFIETGFGRVWALRLAGLLAIFICALFGSWSLFKAEMPAICGLSAGLLVSAAWLGHAAAAQGSEGYANIASYACHVLAAGAWLGALLPLSQRLRRRDDIAGLQASLEHFSRLGMTIVTLIVATGIVNAYLRSVTFLGLISTDYGRLLAVKLALFFALLGLAASNRWIFLRRLRQNSDSAHVVRSLYRSVLLEQLLGASIIGVAVVLGATPPPE